MTSGLGSPTTSQWIMTVSPSTASVDLGLVTNRGTLEYLKHEVVILQCVRERCDKATTAATASCLWECPLQSTSRALHCINTVVSYRQSLFPDREYSVMTIDKVR
jgi:hypothetical protein